MPRKNKSVLPRQQHHNNEETPEETFVALNEMEENLRRLGLREESGAPTTETLTSAGGTLLAKDPHAYLASIKKAKDEAIRLRHEKEYRQFAAEEQKRENESMLAVVERENALRDVIEKAGCLLGGETRLAREATAKRTQKVGMRLFRAEELEKKESLRKRIHQMMKNTTTPTCASSQLIVLDSDGSQRLKNISKTNLAVEYCYTIAIGLVEVAMRVADGMYTISADTGLPVRRVPQDLSVTQWRTWVDEFIFPQITLRPLSDFLATNSLRDLCDPNYKNIATQKEEAFASSNAGNDQIVKEPPEVTREGGNKENNTETVEDIIKRVSAMQCRYEETHILSGIAEAARLIKNNEKMKLGSDLDEVRCQQDSHSPEEVVPGWMHRLPPVGCFVYGDDLSGLRALVDFAGNDGMHDAPAAPQRRQWSASITTDSAKGVTGSESNPCENLPYRILTPFLLTRILVGSALGQGGGTVGVGAGAVGSGSYSSAGAKIKWNTAVSYATGRTREGKQQGEDILESKQYIDSLSDALVKEVIAVYLNNLQLVLRSETDAMEASTGVTEAMRTLLLVNFPESEAFWRTLQQKLLPAVEGAEQEMNKLLKLKEANEDMQSQTAGLTTPSVSQGSPTRKSGQKTSTSQEGIGGIGRKRSPQGTMLSTGRKGAMRASVLTNDEDTESQRNRVYPPLCLLGVFLQYDVPSRYRRMRMANQTPSVQSSDQKSLKTSTTTSGEEGGGESFVDWSISRLRHELIHQDRKMRRVLKTWCSNIVKTHVTSDADVEKPGTERLRKRLRSIVSRKASDLAAMGALPTPPSPPSQPIFPKVLFFRRKENVSSASGATNPLEILINVLKAMLNPANRGIISHENLVPGQLVAPLRLSDYRFPSSVLMRLVELQQRFQNRWNESSTPTLTPSVVSHNSTRVTNTVGGKENGVAMESAVLIETEMYRVFRTFSTDLLWFMSYNVFPPSLWTTSMTAAGQRSGNIPATIGGNGGGEFFSCTTHFVSVDRNYNESRESLYGLQVEGMSKLTSVCALLLYSVFNIALASLGKALESLCSWVRGHLLSASNGTHEVWRTVSPGSPFVETAKEETIATQRMSLTSDSASQHFLDSVPRLNFTEIQTMVEQLDGETTSFHGFQRALWSYASRVHETALDCFRTFVEDVCEECGVEDSESLEEMASPVARILLEHLFTFAPKEEKLGTFGSNASTISVTIGRVIATVRSLRRCCTVAGVCAARWIDSMYATALAIAPSGSFPVECRPRSMVDIFSPPELVEEVGGAPPPSLALQLLSTLAPAMDLSSDEVRDCWRETEFEVILQNFSIYQKPVLFEAEFIHCMMQVELNSLWKFLPSRLHTLAARLGITLPFSSTIREDTGEMEDKDKLCTDFIPPWFKNKHYLENTKMAFVTEHVASQMFHTAVQSQQHDSLKHMSAISISSGMGSSASTLRDMVVSCRAKTLLLHLREFFISTMLQRLCFDGSSGSFNSVVQTGAFREPSTMELRTMIRSLPYVLREQGPGEVPGFEQFPMKEWKRIKWWPFFDDPSLSSHAAFIQRYMLRILTVCFGFVNGELCARCVPFLPDLLYAVAAMKGPQDTVVRYFHVLAALNSARTKKLSYSQLPNRAGATTNTTTTTTTAVMGVTDDFTVTSDSPLMAFQFTLSVEEALFFFQRAGEELLRGPCARGLGHVLSSQQQELQNALSIEEMKHGSSHKSSKDDMDDDCDDEGLLPLEAELTLLLEIEGRMALSLSALCATHWGQQIIPRLTRIPFTENTVEVGRSRRGLVGEGTISFHTVETPIRARSTSFI